MLFPKKGYSEDDDDELESILYTSSSEEEEEEEIEEEEEETETTEGSESQETTGDDDKQSEKEYVPRKSLRRRGMDKEKWVCFCGSRKMFSMALDIKGSFRLPRVTCE